MGMGDSSSSTLDPNPTLRRGMATSGAQLVNDSLPGLWIASLIISLYNWLWKCEAQIAKIEGWIEGLEGKKVTLQDKIVAQLNQISFDMEWHYKEVLRCNEELEILVKAF